MIDINKKYQTRDGRPVEITTTRARGDWPVVGYIGGDEYFNFWNREGAHVRSRLTATAVMSK